MLTVVEEMDPGQPRDWQEAAAICVSEIFSQIERPLRHLIEFEESSTRRQRLVSSSGSSENNVFLECVLEALSFIDNQFEGMVQNMEWFKADQMYWVEEWKILGSLAVAAGIKNGELCSYANPELQEWSKTISTFSASPATGPMDLWMLENEISNTLIRKQSDYGHHNISRFGRRGIVVRCHDKVARLKNLHLVRAGVASNESIVDTYIDIIGYSAIGMMWERGWFLLDLTKD